MTNMKNMKNINASAHVIRTAEAATEASIYADASAAAIATAVKAFKVAVAADDVAEEIEAAWEHADEAWAKFEETAVLADEAWTKFLSVAAATEEEEIDSGTIIKESIAELNRLGDEANKEISRLNKVLSGLGLEVWCEGINSKILECTVFLGYAKVKDEWGIAISKQASDTGRSFVDVTPCLLHKSERMIRILTVPHLPELLKKITKVVNDELLKLSS